MAPNVKNTVIELKPLINGSSKNQLYSGTVAVDPDNEMVTHQTENTIAWVHDVPHRGEYYFITW